MDAGWQGHTGFSEAIGCALTGNKDLHTNLAFTIPDNDSGIRVNAAMRIDELGLEANFQSALDEFSPLKIDTLLRDLKRQFMMKLMEDIKVQEHLLSNIGIGDFEGSPDLPASPSLWQSSPPLASPGQSGQSRSSGSQSPPDTRTGYLPSRRSSSPKAGAYLPQSRGQVNFPGLSKGYLSNSPRQGATPAAPSKIQHTIEPVADRQPSPVTTHYPEIEKVAGRLLSLKELVRGMIHLQTKKA